VEANLSVPSALTALHDVFFANQHDFSEMWRNRMLPRERSKDLSPQRLKHLRQGPIARPGDNVLYFVVRAIPGSLLIFD
jgi:hypothetical protein